MPASIPILSTNIVPWMHQEHIDEINQTIINRSIKAIFCLTCGKNADLYGIDR
jgi:hypothetical protein